MAFFLFFCPIARYFSLLQGSRCRHRRAIAHAAPQILRRNIDRYYAYHYPDQSPSTKDGEKFAEDDGGEGENIDEGGETLLSAAADANAADAALTRGAGAAAAAIAYKRNMLLLGYVDFLRLFAPEAGPLAVPYTNPTAARTAAEDEDGGGISNHKTRVIQVMRMRKLVGASALRVQWYVKAVRVARMGWHVPAPSIEKEGEVTADGLPASILLKRMAYDSNLANIRRDMFAKNEYYEPSVGRDVQCNIHSLKHLQLNGASQPSAYQAYTLVGCHAFHLPPTKGSDSDKAHLLQANRDPVDSIPSLRRIIESNATLDFFVVGFFPEEKCVAFVCLFVRTLPRGIDAKFDATLDNFIHGNDELRDRKLNVFMQLGPGPGLSRLAWGAIKVISAVLSWSRSGETQIPSEQEGYRTPFPGMRMSRYMNTRYFGGALKATTANTSPDTPPLPKNYVSVTSHIDGSDISNFPMRILYTRLEGEALQGSNVDFTFVLEGEKEEELPERALASIRFVHVDTLSVALPASYSAKKPEVQSEEEEIVLASATQVSEEGAEETKEEETIKARQMQCHHVSQASPEHSANKTALQDKREEYENKEEEEEATKEDPIQVELDTLREILEGVTVPVRRANTYLVRPEFIRSNSDAAEEYVQESNLEHDDIKEVLASENDDRPHKKPKAQHEDQSKPLYDTVNIHVLDILTQPDLRRFYLANDNNLKTAAVRLVKSAAWRGITFPIDTRVCRVELQSGQFFQHGRDKTGQLVFYFRNMCLGPWRKDVDATILAVLHRLEISMEELQRHNPNMRCTLIVLMGKPIDKVKVGKGGEDEDGSSQANVVMSATKSNINEEKNKKRTKKTKVVKKRQRNPFFPGADPR